MSGVINLGGDDASFVAVDLERLLRSRLLIQASSGGGKSWLIRRLVEELFGKVQVIIFDPEGEFATLRERFDFLLVGKGGETTADPRSAELLAHRVLELGVSAVCDLFEMKREDRHLFVANFLNAMIDAPKHLWRPVVVVVDEAHMFCPEKGAGESVASESVTALATRGRKRGFCAVLATQRLGKLRKDTAAELANVLIGRTSLDVDRDRAVDALGIARTDRDKFHQDIKKAKPGQFYGIGPAIADDTILVKVGPVKTTHPEPGDRAADAPPPTANIRHLLPRLGDLPKEAEKKARTEAELRAEVAQLRRDLEAAKRVMPAPEVRVERVEVPSVPYHIRAAVAGQADKIGGIRASIERACSHLQDVEGAMATINWPSTEVAAKANGHATQLSPLSRQIDRILDKIADEPVATRPKRGRPTGPAHGDGLTRDGARRMLRALASRHPQPLSKVQIATLSGLAVTGGGFRNYLGTLRTMGYVTGDGGALSITPEGLAAAGPVEQPAGAKELLAVWLAQLDRKGARDILELLAREHGPMPKEQIAQAVGLEVTGGGFRNYIGKLRSLELIRKAKGGMTINPELAL